ncbi:MAG: hypothetical protein H8E51_00450 [Bacteroidetes bacterium]|nr:hypothetical protein [Bacteroidota bacterium]
MKKGIIKAVTPQIQDGVHKSWINKYTGKPNYGFTILFEDGTTGYCGSEKTIYPLAVGTLVTYEMSSKPNGSTHITKVKRFENNGNGKSNNNGRSYNDPVTVKRIAFSMCQTIARMHFANAEIPPKSPQEVNQLAGIYNEWVTSDIPETDPHFRDLISRRYYALQLAVECIPFTDLGIMRKEHVIETAETFLKPVKEIGHAVQV